MEKEAQIGTIVGRAAAYDIDALTGEQIFCDVNYAGQSPRKNYLKFYAKIEIFGILVAKMNKVFVWQNLKAQNFIFFTYSALDALHYSLRKTAFFYHNGERRLRDTYFDVDASSGNIRLRGAIRDFSGGVFQLEIDVSDAEERGRNASTTVKVFNKVIFTIKIVLDELKYFIFWNILFISFIYSCVIKNVGNYKIF